MRFLSRAAARPCLRSARGIAFIGSTFACLIAGVGARADAGSSVDSGIERGAEQRLCSALRGAVAGDLARGETARAASNAASLTAELAPDAPRLHLAREGLSLALDDELNAIGRAGVEIPVATPSQRRSRRQLADGQDTWLSAQTTVSRLAAAETAGRLWLDAAAAESALELSERRRVQIESAVALQRVRFEVGEVAGIDVVMLELELAAAESALAAARARREAASSLLQAALPALGDANRPRAGDLARLTASRLDMYPSGTDAERGIEDTPRWRAIRTAMERERFAALARHALAAGEPSLLVEWQHVPSLAGEPSIDAAGIALQVPLPVGSRRRAARRARDALDDEHEARAATQRRMLRAQVEGAQAEARAQAVSVARLARLAADSRAELALSEQFRLGAITYLELTSGLERLGRLQHDLLESRHQLLGAHLELATLLARGDLFPLPEPLADVAACDAERHGSAQGDAS